VPVAKLKRALTTEDSLDLLPAHALAQSVKVVRCNAGAWWIKRHALYPEDAVLVTPKVDGKSKMVIPPLAENNASNESG
jgi:hypothetical protein